MPTVADLVAAMQAIAPLSLAAEWDNVGLLLGDGTDPVERVMTCLTVTPDSAAEAIEAGVQLIVSHHPVLFRAVKRLTSNNAEGRILLGLAKAGVAVYSPHTAWDNAVGGINDILAAKLQLTNVRPLRAGDAAKQAKIVVFVPDSDLAKVSDAMFAAGAGHIGPYRECSFRMPGTGTFYGTDAANPTIGQKGRREDVVEWRLEVLCPDSAVDRVVRAMRLAHSYEEPAYDVYPLRPERAKIGEGRLGMLPGSRSLRELVQLLRTTLKVECVQSVGSPDRQVQRVAIACGAAAGFLPDAVAGKADVFLTGEARFHDALAAEADGIALVLAGHYATERIGIEALAEQLQQSFPGIEVWPSRRERDPLALLS